MPNVQESPRREGDVLSKTIRPTLPEGRLEIRPETDLTELEFFELCRRNEHLQLERDPDGTIIVMSPSGARSSNRGGRVFAQLLQWSDARDAGEAFDSSGGFTLPNAATRAPDAAWISGDRLETLSDERLERFIPLAPDFVAEIRSQSDSRSALEEKMREYADNGVRLGWLIDSYEKIVIAYRGDGSVVQHDEPDALSGDPVLPGFTCDFQRIWNPKY